MFASGNDREISGTGCNGGEDDDEDDEADESGGGGGIRGGGGGGGNDNCDESGKKQRGGGGGNGYGCNRSTKRLLLYPFSKARRKFRQRKNRRGDSSSSPADVTAASAPKGSRSSSGSTQLEKP